VPGTAARIVTPTLAVELRVGAGLRQHQVARGRNQQRVADLRQAAGADEVGGLRQRAGREQQHGEGELGSGLHAGLHSPAERSGAGTSVPTGPDAQGTSATSSRLAKAVPALIGRSCTRKPSPSSSARQSLAARPHKRSQRPVRPNATTRSTNWLQR
jgi:hypothetical protein